MGDAAKVAHHHAEAMIERHRNAQPLAGLQAYGFADEVAVVEDVMVRERSALRKTCRTAGELDVDGLVELQGRLDLRKALLVGGRPGAQRLVKRQTTGMLAVPQCDHQTQRRRSCCVKRARSA